MRNSLHKNSSPAEKRNVSSSCKNYKELTRWCCEICGLILTSKIQAQEHFSGKKHQNIVRSKDSYNQYFYTGLKLNSQDTADKKKNLGVFDRLQKPSSKSSFNKNIRSGYNICDSEDIIPPPAGRDNILETVIKSEKKTFYSSDLSIYRTPSGKYYCQSCNITVNSQAQFLQHSESRKHRHKVSKMSVKVSNIGKQIEHAQTLLLRLMMLDDAYNS